MSGLLPGQKFPTIDLPRVGGGRIDNSIFANAKLTILNSYRGLHCPRCKRQLQDFLAHLPEFREYDAQIVTFSTDTPERAAQAAEEWELGEIAVGHSLTLDQARALGLFVSQPVQDSEPRPFAEPAVFIVEQDGTLWGSVTGTSPFIRPTAEQLLDAIKVKTDRSYPARGGLAA